jgi:ABC-type nitrate/sulfonate/bicarbonate transport system substrate-binding protein
MRRSVVFLAVAVLAAASACAGAGGPTIERLRVAYSGVYDFDDLPSLVANDRLAVQGIAVEAVHFRTAELIGEALVRGDVDVAIGSNRTFWTLAARGLPVRTVLNHVADVHRFVAPASIQSCRDLSKRTVGLNSEGSAGTALTRRFFAETCPGTEPHWLMLPQSNNRIVALESGSLTASVLKLAEAVELAERLPGRFHVIGDFFRLWPEVLTAGVHVNTAFARAHAQTLTDYVRAQLDANEELLDRRRLLDVARHYLDPAVDWEPIADAYLALPAWTRTGRFSREEVAASLAFYFPGDGATTPPSVDEVADFAFVEQARSSRTP